MSASSTSWLVLLAATLGTATQGCTLADLNPAPPKTPEEVATSTVSARCSADVDEVKLVPVVSGGAVESVEPLYARSSAGTRLDGAVIHVRPAEGVTAEWLDRALECHGAKRALALLPSDTIVSDPFWLPGRTVEIDARAARAGFRIAVRSESTDDAREVLMRATAFFVASQRASAPARGSVETIARR